MRNPSQSYGGSPDIWDHISCHPTLVNTLTPAKEASTRFAYHGGWKAEWTLVLIICIPRWFTCPQTVTHPDSIQLIATWPLDRKSSVLTVMPPRHQLLCAVVEGEEQTAWEKQNEASATELKSAAETRGCTVQRLITRTCHITVNRHRSLLTAQSVVVAISSDNV